MGSSRLRPLAYGVTLATGIGLVGAAAYGVTSMDGRLAEAAQREQVRQHQQLQHDRQVSRRGHDGPCPRELAPERTRRTTTRTVSL